MSNAIRPRVIPSLLLAQGGLVKTRKFKERVYIGDPINAVRIFSEKEVDEIVLLDIDATRQGRDVDLNQLTAIAGECFVPLGYGGGIRKAAIVEKLFAIGVEKLILNTVLHDDPTAVRDAVRAVGSQSIVASIDVRRDWRGRSWVYTADGMRRTSWDPVSFAKYSEELGVGEILLTDMDRDGMMRGMNVALIKSVANAVGIPVVASGGAGNFEHLSQALIEGQASAVAAGSLFVFQGPHRAVLITYPKSLDLLQIGAAWANSIAGRRARQ